MLCSLRARLPRTHTYSHVPTHSRARTLTLAAVALFLCASPIASVRSLAGSPPRERVDDRELSIHSTHDADQRRAALRRFIWGAPNLPKSEPTRVIPKVESPIPNLDNLQRVDRFEITVDARETSLAYHFIPARSERALIILHHGHDCSLQTYGIAQGIRSLLAEGYGVLAFFMPRCQPDNCSGSCTDQHEKLFSQSPPTRGSALKYFLEPLAASLNYLEKRSQRDQFPNYSEFHLAGLSGGGWTTTVYAAIDPRIRLSFPVAGSLPLYLRSGGSVGDVEQTLPDFYRIAGYPDLYLLGSLGQRRKQTQILIRKDDCCFGQAQHAGPEPYDRALRDYEWRIQEKLRQIGSGDFKLEIDEKAPSHLLSEFAVREVILFELRASPTRKR